MRSFVAAISLTIVSCSAAAQVSSGTAFSVAPGLLVTNQHVVAGCSSVDVIARDGRRTGSILDADAQIDLVLLRVNGIKGDTARLRNPRNVRLGEPVMVFGFPLTGSLSSGGNFTLGVVSGLRGLRDAAGEIQITAPVQPGNSGGPALDASGAVIGVVQAKLDALRSAIATGDIPQNVNFAISLEVLADFLTKNNVPFRNSNSSKPLDTARVADLAQKFTYRVECRVKSQQAEIPPAISPQPPRAIAPLAPSPQLAEPKPVAPPPLAITPKPPSVTEPRFVSKAPISLSSEGTYDLTHSLSLNVVLLEGSGWNQTETSSMLTTASKILEQCGIGIKEAQLYIYLVPHHMLNPRIEAARQLVSILNLSTPLLVLAATTPSPERFGGEVFGTGNTRNRPELRHSAWISSATHDRDALLARLLVIMLRNSPAASSDPDNLLYGTESASTRTTLDSAQCNEVRKNGEQEKLLAAITAKTR